MTIERAFGILKNRWLNLLKRIDISFQNVPNIVTVSLCILENDDLGIDWTRSAEKELQREANMALDRMHERDRFMSLESSLKEMKELKNQHLRSEETTFIEPKEEEEMDNKINFEEGETNKERQEKMKNVLANCIHMYELLAKSFYKVDLGQKSKIWFEGYSSNSESEIE